MNKNTVLFLVLSVATIGLYFYFFPATKPANQPAVSQTAPAAVQTNANNENVQNAAAAQTVSNSKEQLTTFATDAYKVVFTNKGAAVKSWQIKERSGKWIDLVLHKDSTVLATFPDAAYTLVPQKLPNRIVFEYVSPEGWKIVKAYELSQTSLMHNLTVTLTKTRSTAKLPEVSLFWGPGLGTDERELRENSSQTRVIAFSSAKAGALEQIKKGESANAADFKWAAIDNRYFLVAFIPENSSYFNTITAYQHVKKDDLKVVLTATPSADLSSKTLSLALYAGPKGYTYLRSYGLGLEKSINFGFFGFLGKIALLVLYYFSKVTGNFGWGIILVTIVIQILVLPLTLKSFRSAAAMKRVQPMIKEIQTKYKDDPKRLQAEMMNIYKAQKVNPLGGCLPMLLQLPILWAFYTMLRNTYELRNQPWILWVKDLSAADNFLHLGFSLPFLGSYLNLLPLIMGVGMFFQQKMMAASSDPMQRNMMIIMPVLFTVMSWNFPSGLVLYWLTNSIFSTIVQYMVIRKEAVVVKPA